MRLPFISNKGFERLPGDNPICYGMFHPDQINALLEKKERKVLGTAARFLQVPETEIAQVIPMSTYVVAIFFKEKGIEFDYGDEE